MSDPAPLPVMPLAYAAADDAASPLVRPRWLLGPNLAAMLLPLLPIVFGRAPVLLVVRQVGRLLSRPNADRWATLLMSAAVLLAFPLGLWTLRLVLARPARPFERIAAWSVTICSITLTLLVMAYAASYGSSYLFGILLGLFVLLAGAVMMAKTPPRYRRTPAVGLAMLTMALAAHVSMSLGISIYGSRGWSIPACLAALITAAQVLACGLTVRSWRRGVH